MDARTMFSAWTDAEIARRSQRAKTLLDSVGVHLPRGLRFGDFLQVPIIAALELDFVTASEMDSEYEKLKAAG